MPRAELPSFCGLIGRSPAMRALFRRIERVAPFDVPVLIQGERGTGKELIADAIQRGSRRPGRSYVKVNCAALPSDLLASELFGHERGAFTGALLSKPGLLAVADGGTLFLDEIGDLSPQAQAMLLRFLEGGEVRPVGSVKTFRADVRLIAATNKDLERAIREREFRADLYDRLSGVVLEVPPLRERREDIPLLVAHFLVLSRRRHGVRIQGVTSRALRALQSYSWPGNVRELEKTVSRAVIFARGGWVRPEELGLPPLDGADDGSGLSHRRREALRIALLQGAVSRGDLVALFGISGEAARQDLAALVRAGFLRRAGRGRGARYCPGEGRRASSRQNQPSSASS